MTAATSSSTTTSRPMCFDGTIDYFIATTFNTPTETEAFKYAAYDGLSRLENRVTLTAHA